VPRMASPKRSTLTCEAQLSLAHAAWTWAESAVLLRRPRSTTNDEWDFSQLVIIQTVDAVEFERYRRGLHMLCLALQHLDRCLELLISSRLPADFPGDRARRFRRTWRTLQDLRDVLEHEEEYLAGRGRNPALVVKDTHGWINIRGVQVATRPHQETRNAEGLLVGYRVQGRDYDLSEVLRCTAELAPALREFLFPNTSAPSHDP
jgi:hypothetical protein